MGIEVLGRERAAELAFWRGLVQSQGEYYYAYRVSEYYEKTRYFPSFPQQRGSGADIGCGCISVFEGSSKHVAPWDRLAQQYETLLDEFSCLTPRFPMRCCTDSQIDCPDAEYEWVACLNMIDHTPTPENMLREIHRILRPDGRLYFEVNLEAGLAEPHFQVWTEDLVEAKVSSVGFKETHRYVQHVPEHRQKRYWAEYTPVHRKVGRGW